MGEREVLVEFLYWRRFEVLSIEVQSLMPQKWVVALHVFWGLSAEINPTVLEPPSQPLSHLPRLGCFHPQTLSRFQVITILNTTTCVWFLDRKSCQASRSSSLWFNLPRGSSSSHIHHISGHELTSKIHKDHLKTPLSLGPKLRWTFIRCWSTVRI